MAKPFLPVTVSQIGSENTAQLLKLYPRNSKPGYCVLGQVLIGGITHYWTGWCSPGNPKNVEGVILEAPAKAKRSRKK